MGLHNLLAENSQWNLEFVWNSNNLEIFPIPMNIYYELKDKTLRWRGVPSPDEM